MSSLLDRSLDDIRDQDTRSHRGASRGSRGTQRSSPYGRAPRKSTEGQWQHDMFDSPAGGALKARMDGSDGAGGGSRTSSKLIIKNLHYEVSERELESLFEKVGPLAKAPAIKFDRSGRSEGVAWVTFSNESDALKAHKMFNGANAKGQPISIEYDLRVSSSSLLTRLGGGSTGRGGRGGSASIRGASRGSSRGGAFAGARVPSGPASGSRGGGAGRGGRGGARGGARGKGEKREDKTATDLDKELEAFMNEPSGGAAPAAEGGANADGDTEMGA